MSVNSGLEFHTHLLRPYLPTINGMANAVGKYIRDPIFPSQFTSSKVMLKSAATAFSAQSACSKKESHDPPLLDIGPNHGQLIAVTIFRMTCIRNMIQCFATQDNRRLTKATNPVNRRLYNRYVSSPRRGAPGISTGRLRPSCD